jgi:mono/diheme cytochrome c family protein
MNHKLKPVFWTACAFLCGMPLLSQAPQTLPDGKGKAEFVHNCTACHRADMVTAVKKTPDDWQKSVFEMASRGTDGTKEDLDSVVLYLDKFYSLDKPVPADAKPAAPPAASETPTAPNHSEIERAKRMIAENNCLGCHRIEQQGASTAPSLNGVGARHTVDELRAAIANHHPSSGSGSIHPEPPYEGKIAADDLNDLVRYLSSLPPSP